MSFSPGTRIGPYEIVASLGAGGMGEVYRARDPRMGREVAVKVSAERFTDRFEREVRAVAALNHPNICQIYDVGPSYLVMELVDGPTLSGRIKQGALPLEEALAIARQIAEALEAAHEKGVIHRDLKPANIKIKPDGTVKVLDFGLAKMAEAAVVAGSPDESPTMPMEATRVGQIMGTAAYMAPEQARGETVDKRADIWAFGVVLYEMLSGRRLFEGETISDTLAGVLTKEPDWNRVPAKALRLLKSCLEKDPKRRLRDIADALRLLEDAPAAPVLKRATRWKAAAGVLVAVSAISIWLAWRAIRSVEATPQALMQLDLDLGPEVSLASTAPGPAAILSPDGTRLVFTSQGQDGARRLFTRRLDQGKATPLPKTEGAYAPFFSPDGQWVGFFAHGKLLKILLDGGEPVALCDAPIARGGTWGEDGNIIAALDSQTGLSQVAVEGGKVMPLTELAPREISHRWPHALPGGKAALFTNNTAWGNHDEAGIAVVSLTDHKWKTVMEHAGTNPRYLRSGQLVFVANGTLFAAPFDLNRLEIRGPAKPVLENLWEDSNLGFSQLDFSRGGMMLFRRGRSDAETTVQWLDGAGKTESLLAEPLAYQFPRLSPDGSRLAFVVTEGSGRGLWIYDWRRGGKIRLTSGFCAYPVWSSDGTYLVFTTSRGMFWTRSDAADKPEPLLESKNTQVPGAFNGNTLVFTELIPGVGGEIRTVAFDGGSRQLRVGNPRVFLKVPTYNAYPAFSPDGRWLAFATAAAGVYEVYVRAFPDNGSQVPVSNAGGLMPVWSRTGHELFYRTEDQRIMVASYRVQGDAFVPDKPRVWVGKELANTGQTPNLDIAADGKRFVVVMTAGDREPREAQSHVMLALNFFDEVRRRLGGQGK